MAIYYNKIPEVDMKASQTKVLPKEGVALVFQELRKGKDARGQERRETASKN